MELGTGIFLSSLFIGTVLLFNATKDRWNWKKGLLYLFLTFIVIGLLGGGGLFFYSQYEDRPQVQSELLGLKLGMSKDDVLFLKGKHTEEGSDNDGDGKYSWSYIPDDKNSDRFRVTFFEDKIIRVLHFYAGEYRTISLGGISQGNSAEVITEKYGEPDSMSMSDDGQSRTYNYDKYHVSYSLSLNKVNAVAVYDPKHNKGLFFVSTKDKNESAGDENK